jgi:hypothetical protein
MTIGKGTAWAQPGGAPVGAPVFSNDSDLASYVHIRLREQASSLPIASITGGSLWQTIGGPSAVGRYQTSESMQYPCDLVIVGIHDLNNEVTEYPFVASLVARRRGWAQSFVAMNAQSVGAYRFGHRAHPNDGLVDCYQARLSIGDVMKVAKRAKLGAHLPHPGITEARVSKLEVSFDHPRQLWLDSVKTASVKTLTLRVVPDAFVVVV